MRVKTAVTPRTRQEFRACARWWEMEAVRSPTSKASSMEYARNMRWAAELAGIYGPGTWDQLKRRRGMAT